MVLAVPDLIVLALMFMALALALMSKKVVEAILGGLIAVLQAIPVIGGKLASPLVAAERAISSAMGDVVAGIEKGIGKAWHAQAMLLNWLWREIKDHGLALLLVATPLSQLLTLYRAIRSYVHGLGHANHLRASQVKTMEHELHGIEVKLRHLEHDVSKGIGEDVLPRLRSLDREVSRIEHGAIPSLREADSEATKAISDLWTWVHQNALVVGTTAFVGAVSLALSRLGLGGLRCTNFTNLLSKFGCGLGSLLDALLGLAISALALENVCTLLPIAETAFGDVVGPVTHLLTEVPLGGCETPPQGWALLSVATGPLPPPQTLGTLAA